MKKFPLSPCQNSCQTWRKNWPNESLSQHFPGCISGRLIHKIMRWNLAVKQNLIPQMQPPLVFLHSVVKCVVLASPGFLKDQFYDWMMATAVRTDNRLFIENKSKFLRLHSSSGHKHALKGQWVNANSNIFYLLFCLGPWLSYLMTLLSLRLVGARINVRSPYSQWVFSMTRSWTQNSQRALVMTKIWAHILTVASSAFYYWTLGYPAVSCRRPVSTPWDIPRTILKTALWLSDFIDVNHSYLMARLTMFCRVADRLRHRKSTARY